MFNKINEEGGRGGDKLKWELILKRCFVDAIMTQTSY